MENTKDLITVVEVLTLRQQRQFHALPRVIYRDYAAWIEPLHQSIEAIFDPRQNPLFKGGGAVRFIATYNNICVGRIAAFYTMEEKLKAEVHQEAVGGCGFFESIDSQEVADALFGAAEKWLKELNFTAMDAPINFGNRDAWWGLLVEGFEYSPLFENSYNPPYYQALVEGCGLRNYFDQITYHMPPNGCATQQVRGRAERLKNEGGYEVRAIKRGELRRAALSFREIYNLAWSSFEGFKPLSEEHCRALFEKLAPIIDPRLIRFAYHNDTPIGFSIMIPDLNPLIAPFGGHFGWWEKLQLIWKIRVKRSARRLFGVVFGVLPEFQGRGVESLLIDSLNCDLKEGLFCDQYTALEFAWIGDFNPVMQRMMERYVGAKPLKKHTTYRLYFDPHHPFERCPPLTIKRR